MSKPYEEKGFFAKLRILPKRGLGRVVETALILWAVLTDPDVPTWCKILVASALAYFVCPVDALPDFLPGGFLDDFALLATTLGRLSGFVTEKTRERAREKRRELGL